jgi:hypothetical protein
MRCEACGYDGPALKQIGHDKNADAFKKGVRLAKLAKAEARLAEMEEFVRKVAGQTNYAIWTLKDEAQQLREKGK